MLTEIHHKLDGGIAICCLQKNQDNEWGDGGQKTRNKASLALNLDYGKVTVVKAKNYRTEINPNRFVMNFKILDGIKLLPEGIWGLE